MSQGDSQNAAGPAGGWRRLGTPVVVALAGLMAVGGYQFGVAARDVCAY
jgi:hypothetical protein